jgi:molybdate transport system permease protein
MTKFLQFLPQILIFSISIVSILFLILPILGLHTLSHASTSVWNQTVFIDALYISFITSGISLVCIIIMMTPLAWFLSKRSHILLWRFIENICLLPLVLPPTVCGIALLWLWGAHHWGTYSLALSTSAVIIAQIFVAAPIYLKAMSQHFRHIPPTITETARTLGKTSWQTLYTLHIPMSLPTVINVALLTWLRAMGEFGATLLFAGHLQGYTQTLPLAIYTTLEQDLHVAVAMALWLLWIAIFLSITIQSVFNIHRTTHDKGH